MIQRFHCLFQYFVNKEVPRKVLHLFLNANMFSHAPQWFESFTLDCHLLIECYSIYLFAVCLICAKNLKPLGYDFCTQISIFFPSYLLRYSLVAVKLVVPSVKYLWLLWKTYPLKTRIVFPLSKPVVVQ